jgi:hypothetical protein
MAKENLRTKYRKAMKLHADGERPEELLGI